MPATLECEAEHDRDVAVQRAAQLLRRGGVVVFPTETVYGVGASAASEAGLARLRALKQRPDDQPFSVHIGDPADAERYVDLDADPLLRRLIRKTMPGPVTLVVEVAADVIERKLAGLGLPPGACGRLYHQNTIGLRCPDHPVGAALLRAVGEPVVASSANRAGDPAPTDAAAAAAAIGDEVDLILDDGPTRFARASTIITLRGGQAQVIREGVVDDRYLRKLLRTTLLFVCSGNTCRSPMAEAIARHEATQRLGIEPGKLDDAGVQVLSAGAFAYGGSPMSPEAAEALAELGVPVPRHHARPLTAAMILQADAVYCMGATHRQVAAALAPSATSRVQLLDPAGSTIDDPIGAGVRTYVQCAEQMRELIRVRLDELGIKKGSLP